MSKANEAPRSGTSLLCTVDEVAELLGVGRTHVYTMTDGGLMPPPVHLGRSVRWRRTEIEEWIAAGCPRVTRR